MSMSTTDAHPHPGFRTGIATVCLSGTLEDKLNAASAAGFGGVEIFENDLIAAPLSPEEIRDRCAELGLSVDLYQPFRDFESTDEEVFAENLRRAEHKLELTRRLGADTMLVCSSTAESAPREDELVAEQLHALAERASAHGTRIAYEALAWGRHVNTYEHSWRIVQRADHPALGVCLDSFHVLSRGGSPEGVRAIPAEKLFFIQLADAPVLNMDVLQWSRHHRLFPGQGSFDLENFLAHVLEAGYSGPLSLEVFNDVFRQAEPRHSAVDGMRSLIALRERSRRPRAPGTVHRESDDGAPMRAAELDGHAFVEIAVDESSGPVIAEALGCLGFHRGGRHRRFPVELWRQGDTVVLLSGTEYPSARGEQPTTAISALGLNSTEPRRSTERAAKLLAPVLARSSGVTTPDAIAAPDGTSVLFCSTGSAGSTWLEEFETTDCRRTSGIGLGGIDHVGLTQPFDHFDEAALFYRAVLGLEPEPTTELAAPFGLIRSRTVVDPKSSVRIALSAAVLRRGEQWAPGVAAPSTSLSPRTTP